MKSPKSISIFKNTLQCILAGFVTGLLATISLTLIVLIISGDVNAETQGPDSYIEKNNIIKISDIESGTLLFKHSDQFNNAPVLDTNVEFNITGMIARAVVRQKFENPENYWQEGIYVFPLPETAAVDHMRMIIGQRIIEGQIKERGEARKVYEKAKHSGKKTGLIEQERTNIFTTSVANIGPGEVVTIEIEYQQTVNYDSGKFSLRFPMVVAPRYIPGQYEIQGFSGTGWSINTDQVPDAARITPPVLKPQQEKINPVSINIHLDAGFKLPEINSAYHAISIHETNTHAYQIALQEQQIPADRDFVLTWQPEEKNIPVAALFTEQKNNVNYSMLMVLPPKHPGNKILSREIIFVIDTSGSMSGTSIRQARSALLLALDRLTQDDRFNIIQFNSQTHTLFQHSVAVSQQTLQQAREYITGLNANGGTEMASALHAALSNQDEISEVRQIIFLTDGSIGNENQLFKIIQEKISRSRLFTIGIGSAPNSHFMRRAASFGKGTHTYIGNINEVQTKMEALFKKLESPVLTNISIDGIDQNSAEIWPEKIPDLYLGEPLLITLKSHNFPDEVKVSGMVAGSKWVTNIPFNGGNQQKNISVFWARNKIASLMDKKIDQDNSNNIKKEIIHTALNYHLVSRYTSLVAVDITPARIREELLKTTAIPVNLPAGWNHEKVFGQLPRTATPATLYFIFGLILTCLSFLTWLTRIYIYNVK